MMMKTKAPKLPARLTRALSNASKLINALRTADEYGGDAVIAAYRACDKLEDAFYGAKAELIHTGIWTEETSEAFRQTRIQPVRASAQAAREEGTAYRQAQRQFALGELDRKRAEDTTVRYVDGIGYVQGNRVIY